ESAIRKLAQERESKRSEHKPTSKESSGESYHFRRLCASARHPIWCIWARRSPFSTVLGELDDVFCGHVFTGSEARHALPGRVQWTRIRRGSCLRRIPARLCAG